MNLETEIAKKLRNASVISKDEIEARRIVQEQLERLPPHRRGPVAMKIRQQFEAECRDVEASKAKTARLAEALESFADWWGGDFVIEKNECSRLHRLIEASGKRMVYGWNEQDKFEPVPQDVDMIGMSVHVFVIRHNWAAAFEGTEVAAGDVATPFDRCAFEFKFSGVPVIALWHQNEEERAIVFGEFGDFWITLGTALQSHRLLQLVRDQIRAVCVSLDAEVASHEIVRAPGKLNEKRARNGLPPLSDYHVVDLAKRHRISNPAAGTGEPSHHKRLHFVRGHWRHFETHKTWIKWHLRGNPDLGFIAKHYSL